MNYQDYTHTNYNLRKKKGRGDYILTLSKFRNNTLNIQTPISPSSNEIIYLNPDYEIMMTQEHKCTNNEEDIKAHNDYIKHKMRYLI